MPNLRSDVLQPKLWRLSHLQMRQIQRLIQAYAGLSYGSEKDEMLRRRIVDHIDSNTTNSFEEYFQKISVDHVWIENLINKVTINETFLYRDVHQLKSWLENLVRPVFPAQTFIRIWSAACATGEEPVTIALLLESLKPEFRFDYLIDASDINTEVIKRARLGIFPARSLREAPPVVVETYFSKNSQGYQVSDKILEKINFFTHNLFGPLPDAVAEYDYIFLRNVLIYFPDENRQKVLAHLEKNLKRGGYLLMGHCESPMGFSQAFKFFEEPGTLIFKKAV